MAKKGMKRIERTHNSPKNDVTPVPQIQGKAKQGKAKANSIIEGANAGKGKVFHTKPFSKERPISSVYSAIDNDLARDNLENDISKADLDDL